MKKTIMLWMLLNVFVCSNLMAQGEDHVTTYDAYMSALHKSNRFDGSVLIAEKGKIVYQNSFGQADREWGVPNAPDVKYQIASMTKQFTAVMILQLVEEGKLRLDGVITDYLPEYRKDTGSRITIEHLLQHKSGIKSYTAIPGFWTDLIRRHYSKDKAVKELHSGDFIIEPGKTYRYNNSGYCLLAFILEEVTGKSYDENLRERILEPLGLKNTGRVDPTVILKNKAQGYIRVPAGYANDAYEDMPVFIGTGDMYSTVEDLLIWNRAVHKGDLLSEKTREYMFTVHSPTDPVSGHGTSVDIGVFRPERGAEPVQFTAFNGNSPGFHCDVFRYLDKDLAVVFCSNSGYANFWEMAHTIYRLHDGKSIPRPKPYIAFVSVHTASTEGIDEAVRRFNELKHSSPDKYDWGSTDYWLNTMGYRLMDLHWYEEALTVLDLNVKLHPSNANAYDSLAEAYLKAGDKAQSDFYYAKAKEIGETEDTLLKLVRSGKYEEAKAKIMEIRVADPQRSLFTSSKIGPVYGRTFGEGKNEDAIVICELWALGNPQDVGPYFSLARIYKKLDDTDKAISCYQKAIDIDPRGRHVEMAKKELESLRKK